MGLIIRFLEALFGNISRKDIYILSDEDLVARYLVSQDEMVFSVLYQRYSIKIYSKCTTMLRNMEAAQDSTHDIFIKVLTNISKFNKESKFSTWLFSITYNHCIDLIRKEKKSLFKDVPMEKLDAEDEVSDIFLMETKIAKLKIVLDKMEMDDRTLLLMKYQDDLSIKEIGDLLGKEESATKMRIKRAKYRFKLIHDEIYKGED